MSFGFARATALSLALRALAGLFACLVACGPLLEVVHLVVARHAVCAEHGELIEVSGHHSATSEQEAAGQHETPTGDGSGETDEHEHCQLLGRNEPRLALATAATGLLVPAPTGWEAPRAGIDVVAHASGLAVLSAAPKTSPPPSA